MVHPPAVRQTRSMTRKQKIRAFTKGSLSDALTKAEFLHHPDENPWPETAPTMDVERRRSRRLMGWSTGQESGNDSEDVGENSEQKAKKEAIARICETVNFYSVPFHVSDFREARITEETVKENILRHYKSLFDAQRQKFWVIAEMAKNKKKLFYVDRLGKVQSRDVSYNPNEFENNYVEDKVGQALLDLKDEVEAHRLLVGFYYKIDNSLSGASLNKFDWMHVNLIPEVPNSEFEETFVSTETDKLEEGAWIIRKSNRKVDPEQKTYDIEFRCRENGIAKRYIVPPDFEKEIFQQKSATELFTKFKETVLKSGTIQTRIQANKEFNISNFRVYRSSRIIDFLEEVETRTCTKLKSFEDLSKITTKGPLLGKANEGEWWFEQSENQNKFKFKNVKIMHKNPPPVSDVTVLDVQENPNDTNKVNISFQTDQSSSRTAGVQSGKEINSVMMAIFKVFDQQHLSKSDPKPKLDVKKWRHSFENQSKPGELSNSTDDQFQPIHAKEKPIPKTKKSWWRNRN